MNQDSNKIGNLLRTLLYHSKSIEHRLQFYKDSTNQLIHNDKKILTNSIHKVNIAIDNIIGIVRDKKVTELIKKEVESIDVTYISVILEQLYDLPLEDLENITDLIDDYLNKKYEQ